MAMLMPSCQLEARSPGGFHPLEARLRARLVAWQPRLLGPRGSAAVAAKKGWGVFCPPDLVLLSSSSCAARPRHVVSQTGCDLWSAWHDSAHAVEQSRCGLCRATVRPPDPLEISRVTNRESPLRSEPGPATWDLAEISGQAVLRYSASFAGRPRICWSAD